MDMEMGISGETPPNINEPYTKKLVIVICSFLAFFILRHILIKIYNKSRTTKQIHFIHSALSPLASVYNRIENLIVNVFSVQVFSSVCPPLGAFLVVLILVAATVPLLLLNADLALNSNRAGFLVLSLVPFLLSSTGKNSAVALVTGISTIKLNFIHRMMGLAIFILSTVHMAYMIRSWAKFPTFLASQLELAKVQYGLGGYACLCVVVVFSFLPVRKFSYELFLFTHLFGFGFIGVVAIHTPYAMRYFITGLICYLLNLVAVWFVKTYLAQARFEVLPGGCTKISIRLASPMKSHTIGQHINLCIPSLSPFEWHPFTITSIQQFNKHHQTSIEVCVCARGNFTRKLYTKINPEEELRVFVSGPFGSDSIKSDQVLNRYSSLVIACGGAGVTFGIRLFRELTNTLIMREDEGSRNISNVKIIHFNWCVRHPIELEWFREELEQLNYIYDSHDGFPKLKIQLHTTSIESDSSVNTISPEEIIASTEFNSFNPKESSSAEKDEDSTGLFVDETQHYPRKPVDLVKGKRIDIDRLLSSDSNIGAYVCGPTSFNAAFKNSVALHHASTVTLHCEDFGY